MELEVFFMQSIFKKEIDMCKLTAHTHTYHIIIFFLSLYTLCCDFLYVLLGVSSSNSMMAGKEIEIFFLSHTSMWLDYNYRVYTSRTFLGFSFCICRFLLPPHIYSLSIGYL